MRETVTKRFQRVTRDCMLQFRGRTMASVISFINQKGGCGKSSTCLHLAGAFAAAGYRVLLVDMDPQGSLSRGFLGPEAVERLTADETLALPVC